MRFWEHYVSLQVFALLDLFEIKVRGLEDEKVHAPLLFQNVHNLSMRP